MSVMNACDEYMAAIEKGQRLCRELNSFSLSNGIQSRRTNAFYDVEFDFPRSNTSDQIRKILTACGLRSINLINVELKSSNVSEHANPAYTNYLNQRSGILVCSENFKERDENAPGERL